MGLHGDVDVGVGMTGYKDGCVGVDQDYWYVRRVVAPTIGLTPDSHIFMQIDTLRE